MFLNDKHLLNFIDLLEVSPYLDSIAKKDDTILNTLKKDLSENNLYKADFSLKDKEIDIILNIISFLYTNKDNLNNPLLDIPDNIKSYINAIKGLYFKSNFHLDFNDLKKKTHLNSSKTNQFY